MYLAVDIGATKTLLALFSKKGRVVRKYKFRTAQGSRTFLEDLLIYAKKLRKYKISVVVVAIPGIVHKNYSVHFGNRKWDNIDIFTPIKDLFDCPVFLENDASLATLYEGHRLGGRTVFLTFSTGLGGGIVEDGRILPESAHFEPGTKRYVYRGKEMDWEDIAAASSIQNFYHVDKATDLRGKDIMKDIANRVALGLFDIVCDWRPNTIVLGGPLGKIFKLYAKYLPKDLEVKLKRPKRPTESVIYGAYLYAKQKERE